MIFLYLPVGPVGPGGPGGPPPPPAAGAGAVVVAVEVVVAEADIFTLYSGYLVDLGGRRLFTGDLVLTNIITPFQNNICDLLAK